MHIAKQNGQLRSPYITYRVLLYTSAPPAGNPPKNRIGAFRVSLNGNLSTNERYRWCWGKDRAKRSTGVGRNPPLNPAFHLGVIAGIDLARRIPSEWKLRHGQTKWILRRAFEPWLPPEIAQRKKQGFGIPVASWIAESKPPFDAEPRSRFARARVDAHKNRRGDHRLYLYAQWLLDSFEDRRGTVS